MKNLKLFNGAGLTVKELREIEGGYPIPTRAYLIIISYDRTRPKGDRWRWFWEKQD